MVSSFIEQATRGVGGRNEPRPWLNIRQCHFAAQKRVCGPPSHQKHAVRKDEKMK